VPEPKFKLSAGALPYSDGSGDQVKATVERTDEGVMLHFEMVHQIQIDDWPTARAMINQLVLSGIALTKV
jgi:hypothetical protein